MTRSFKRDMWRAGSGDGHYMEWREFHGGSAAPTQRQAARPFISARVSLQPTEAVQSRRFRKTCVRPPTSLSIFIAALRSALRFEFDEFGSSMTRYFKRNMWRAGSGDGHHMEWREFHGGSAAATHSDQLWSHLSQPVSALQPTEAVQSRRFRKTCVKPPTILSMFIGCTAFWIWMNLVQVWEDHLRETCEEQEVEMDIIWNEENFMEARWPPHNEKLQCHLSQPMSACSNSAVALLIWTAGKSDGGRVGNLDASLNFCDTSL